MKLALVLGNILEVLNCITQLTQEYCCLIEVLTAFHMTVMHFSQISICSQHPWDIEMGYGPQFSHL